MKFFAYVYIADLATTGHAYIWFNRKEDHLSESVISAPQAKHQTNTEKRLLKEVQKTHPGATLFDDTERPGSYRCIKIQ